MIGHADGGAVRTVSGAERVHDEHFGQRSQLRAERLEVLGLFLAETGVLQQNDVAVLHGGNGCLGVSADDLVVIGEYNVLAEQLGQANGYGREGELLLRAVLRLAEVGAEDELTAVGDDLFDGGQSGGDTVIVGDHAVLERYVEVTAAKNLFAGKVDVINGVLVEFHDKNILSVY